MFSTSLFFTIANLILPEVTNGDECHDLTAFLMKFNAKIKNTTERLVRKMSRNLIILISQIQTSLLSTHPKIVSMDGWEIKSKVIFSNPGVRM